MSLHVLQTRAPPDFDLFRSNLEEKDFIIVEGEGEQVEKIPREEVVCRFCFTMLQEDHNVLKTKCICPPTLMHQECKINWSAIKCNVCGQDIQIIPVTISMPSPQRLQQPILSKPNSERCLIL
ncbi:hypothetical protein Pfo_016366 [Paulownia fortunei]|nr:hypothetical protein Pfo_016366 [Paulownia fortunei]